MGRFQCSPWTLSSRHGEGDEGGGAHEGDEGREHPCEGDEGGGPEEGDEGRERAREGDEGGGPEEGHEVSWGGLVLLVRSGSPLHAPAPVCVGVSTHFSSSAGGMRW